jgi:ankyrin repeat protein
MTAVHFVIPLLLSLTIAANAQTSSDSADRLYENAQSNDEVAVKSLLSSGVDPNTWNQQGEPAIFAAAIMGNNEILQILIAAGARVDERSKAGDTAMLLVVLQGHRPDIVETLLSLGADANATDGYTKTTPLMQAARGTGPTHTTMIQTLLAHGAQVNIADIVGETPLILALQQNNEASARLLLAAGADVGASDRRGMTPLIAAAQGGGSGAIISTLLGAGAVRDARMDDGGTALSWAAFYGNVPALQVLLTAGSDPNAKAKGGMTPLMDAVIGGGGHPDAVAQLIKAGVAVNAQSDLGETALFCAVPYANSEIVRMLLAAGADPNIADQYGRTPLKMATFGNHSEIGQILRTARGHE